jgi:hydroxyacylglutathione hydrolase
MVRRPTTDQGAVPTQRIAPPPARPGPPIRLTEHLWQVAGAGITHPWDAAAYLVCAGNPVLIDCGSVLGAPVLREHLRTLGVAVGDLGFIVATHGHWDHLSAAAGLGVPLFVHDGDATAVETGDPRRTAASLLYGEAFPPATVSRRLQGGELLTAGDALLDVVATPGHTPGSCSVVVTVDATRVLIAGDTLWGGFHPAIGSDLDQWRTSLQLLADLDVDGLTFGHGAQRLVPQPRQRILDATERFGRFLNPWTPPLYLAFEDPTEPTLPAVPIP